MIGRGHLYVYSYRMRFFQECLEALYDDELSFIKNSAIAIRGAQVEDFDAFLKILYDEESAETVDHGSNIDILTKPL